MKKETLNIELFYCVFQKHEILAILHYYEKAYVINLKPIKDQNQIDLLSSN